MFKIFKRLTAKELSMIILAVIFVCLNVYLNLKNSRLYVGYYDTLIN